MRWRRLLAIMLVLLLAGCARRVDGLAQADEADLLNPPVAFSLDHKLTTGWRVDAAALGLPPGTPLGNLVASTADRAYFITTCDVPCTTSIWLYGIDIRSGKTLFPPVTLPDFPGLNFSGCGQNGPSTLMCFSDEPVGTRFRLWVLDLKRGTVGYTGSTNLSWGSSDDGSPSVQLLQSRGGPSWLVAAEPGKGVHGIGAHGELTWFVPGDGSIFRWSLYGNPDGNGLAVQLASAKDPAYRVFSVSDGHELTPTPPPGTALKRAVTYPGGFAYEFEDGSTAGVLFYDTAGRLLARRELVGYSLLDNTTLPIVLDRNVFRVFRPNGTQAATIPVTNGDAPFFRAAGSMLYQWMGGVGAKERWQAWDLNTGTPGQTCNVGLSTYVGVQGSTVLATLNAPDGYRLLATDMSTCQDRWELHVGDYAEVTQVGDALITHGDYGVASLVPAR